MQGEPVDVEGLDEEKPYISVAGVAPGTGFDAAVARLVRGVSPVVPVRRYYAVDGGHRVLEFTDLTVVVSSVAVGYEGGLVVGATYPDSGAWPYLGLSEPEKLPPLSAGPLSGGGLRFVATRPLADPSVFVDVKGVSDPRVRGYFGSLTYGCGYSRQTMADENRTLLENAALAWCIGRDGGGAVLVDGPLYMVPGGLVAYFMGSGGFRSGYYELKRAYYLATYMRLVADRAYYVAAALESEVPVIGVVKRLVNSRLLVKGLVSCGVLPDTAVRDIELVEYMVRRYSRSGPGVYLVGPVMVVLNALDVLRRALAPPGSGVRGSGTLSMFVNLHRPLYRDRVSLYDVEKRLERAGSIITGVEGVIAKRIYYLYVRGLLGSTRLLRLEFPWHAARDGSLTSGGDGGLRPSSLYRLLGEHVVERDVVLAAEVAYLLGFPEPRSVPAPLAVADRLAKGVAREAAWLLFQVVSRVSTPTYSTLVSMQGEGGGAAA